MTVPALASYDSRPPTMMVGLSHRAGWPFTRRWLRLAGPPHTTQIAWSLSTISATGEERGHRPTAAAKSYRFGQHDPDPRSGEPVRGRDDPIVQELHFVDGDDSVSGRTARTSHPRNPRLGSTVPPSCVLTVYSRRSGHRDVT